MVSTLDSDSSNLSSNPIGGYRMKLVFELVFVRQDVCLSVPQCALPYETLYAQASKALGCQAATVSPLTLSAPDLHFTVL